MDEELLEEIARQLERAKEAHPRMTDIKALAMALGQRFDAHSPEEIERLLKDQWRSAGLFWVD